jgi:hypothetical protein
VWWIEIETERVREKEGERERERERERELVASPALAILVHLVTWFSARLGHRAPAIGRHRGTKAVACN